MVIELAYNFMQPFTCPRIPINLPESRIVNFLSILPKNDFKNEADSHQHDSQISTPQAINIEGPDNSYYQKTLKSLIERIEYSYYPSNLTDLPSSVSLSSLESLGSLEDFIELSTENSQDLALSQQDLEYENSIKEGFYSIGRVSYEAEISSHSIIPPDTFLNIDILMKNFLDNSKAGHIKRYPISSLEEFIFYLKTWVIQGNIQSEAQVFKKMSEKLGISVALVQHLCLKNQNLSKKNFLNELKKKILTLKNYLNDIKESRIKWNKVAENQLVDIENLLENCKNLEEGNSRPHRENDNFDVELFKKMHLAEVYQQRSSIKMINFNPSLLRIDDKPIKGMNFEEIDEFPIEDFIALDM